jgi:hypothetical protein
VEKVSRRSAGITEHELRRSGFPLTGFRFADRPLQVGDAVGRDDDELPTVVAGFVEDVEIGLLAGRVVEVNLAVFPLGHFAASKSKAPASAGAPDRFRGGSNSGVNFCLGTVEQR